ncbi:MAG: exosortase N [Hymenobacteraceae bacterium]|nr:exosortase N [Hymenobacteraceae bacterium]
MELTTKFSVRAVKLNRQALLFLVLYLVLAAVFMRSYLLWNSQWLLGLFLLPFAANPDYRPRSSWLLLCGSLLFLIAAAYLQVTTFYFLGFVLAAWFLASSFLGNISVYPALLLLVASPSFNYAAKTGSFPLRLFLSEIAANVLSLAGLSTEAAGNIILVNQTEFSVDPACAGLSMLTFSMMIAVLMLAQMQKLYRKRLSLWVVMCLMAAMVLLNLGSNLIRIIVLVLFEILPDNPFHDVVGIACLVVYAVLPFYFLSRFVYGKLPVQQNALSAAKPASLLLPANLVLVAVLFVSGLVVQQKKEIKAVTSAAKHYNGFEQQVLQDGVLKLSSKEALIYIKPVKAFYSTEHHPMICWEGSGYLFKHIKEQQYNGQTIFTGTLQKGKEKLVTAWWMENDSHRTISQLDWRWRMLQGEPGFNLVNVTTANNADLNAVLDKVLFIQKDDIILQPLKLNVKLN